MMLRTMALVAAVSFLGAHPALAAQDEVGVVRLPALSGLSVQPGAVTAGDAARGTVTLDGNALPRGTTVRLSSSNPAVAIVPGEVRLAAGTNRVGFAVRTSARGLVAADGEAPAAQMVAIAATRGTVTKAVKLKVSPPAEVAPAGGDTPRLTGGAGSGTLGGVVAVELDPSPAFRDDDIRVRVVLSPSFPFATARTVQLTQSGLLLAAGVASPTPLLVPAGENEASAQVYLAPAVTQPTTASVTATFNSTARTVTLTVEPDLP